MLDHANVAAMCDMAQAGLGITAADHSLLVLPLFHVNGIIVGTLSPLLAGGQVTVPGRFSPKTFFGIVERVRPTYFSAVPAIYAMLTSLPQAATADTSSLRLVVCGAAPMPPELIARVEDTLGVALIEGYGLSEGACASTLNPYDGVRKPGTVGLPLPGQEVRVVDRDGRPVPQGERGEVVIRGANVMRGYLNRPEETAKTLVDGWLHTGDVGVFDADGYLRIVDRIKDMIIRGGENIYPKEIEAALYTHEGVLEAAVVGRPDEVLGEVVVAHVALRPESAATAERAARRVRRAPGEVQAPRGHRAARGAAEERDRQDRQARAARPGRLGELGARERRGDRAVRLAVRHQPDVAAGDLDAVGLLDDRALPAHDAVALAVDGGQAHAVDGERRGVVADERAAALRAEAVGVAAAPREVQAAARDRDRRPCRGADAEQALQVGAHRDRVRDQLGPPRGGRAREVAAAAVPDDRHAAARRRVERLAELAPRARPPAPRSRR